MNRSKKGQALTSLILEVFRTNGALLDSGNRLTKPYGLTSARWQVMGAIDIAGHPLTVSQVSRRMGLSRQAVQRIVNDLVESQMVELQPNPDHKRAPLVSISKTGAETMARIDQAQIAWVNELANSFSERQLTKTTQALEAIRQRTSSTN